MKVPRTAGACWRDTRAAKALAGDYVNDGGRAFAGQLRDFVIGQATRLTKLTGEAAKIKADFLCV